MHNVIVALGLIALAQGAGSNKAAVIAPRPPIRRCVQQGGHEDRGGRVCRSNVDHRRISAARVARPGRVCEVDG
jgi:hypothetical protein